MEINKFIELFDKQVHIVDYLIIKYLKEDKENQKILDRSLKVYGHIADMCERGILTEDENGNYQILIDLCKEEKQEDWVSKLYSDIEKLLIQSEGKAQYKNPSGKFYKPTLQMFRHRIATFIKKFGINDIDGITRACIKYTKSVLSGETKYPVTLEYFVYKSGTNGLISEMTNWMEKEEEAEEVKTNYDGINI